MSYESIDTLQSALKDTVFRHTKDAKKAAGRALGTIVELITYYLLRQWGLTGAISIERGLPEYGNSDIKHNVEFLLHPTIKKIRIDECTFRPITLAKLRGLLYENNISERYDFKSGKTILTSSDVLRNSCLIADNDNTIVIVNLVDERGTSLEVSVLYKSPFAMVECKRVGVEEGCKKGPQTIEKAKQGAYVAQMTSSLQKIWTDSGELKGLIFKNGEPIISTYDSLMKQIVYGDDLLKNFIMSIGVVSNHGNWFTNENKNKELEVLAQSYDWLLFLTDAGLAQFVTDLLLNPEARYKCVQTAFTESYKEGKKTNIFTKSKIDLSAHKALCSYFAENAERIEKWFNVITPERKRMADLKEMLYILANKKWEVFK